MSQRFVPHRKSGYCPLPLNDDPLYLATLIGIKIATGFQILLSEKDTNHTADNRSFNEDGFKIFKQKLRQNNYFEGELEHSKRWKTLEENAMSFYDQMSDGLDQNISYRKITSLGIVLTRYSLIYLYLQ